MEERPPLPDNILEMLNTARGGFNETIGLTFVSATYDAIEAEVEVGPHLLQPYGLVHGGVYSAIIETMASTGAAINSISANRHTVGLENATSFLRAVRKGKLRGKAVPLVRGRRSHVWDVSITDDADQIVARGRVRLLCIEEGAAIAGQKVGLEVDLNG